jgi:hypothetical protein
MLIIKETTNADLFHSNPFGKVNANFAHFVIDFLSMLLLFDAYSDHNANAAPIPWASRNFSMSEQEMIQVNQLVLIKFCLKQNEDMAWNFLAPTTRRVVNWDSRLGNLTICRL